MPPSLRDPDWPLPALPARLYRGLPRYDIEGRPGTRSKRVPRKETEPKGVKGLSKQAMVVTMSENLTVAEIAGMQNKGSGRTDSTARSETGYLQRSSRSNEVTRRF